MKCKECGALMEMYKHATHTHYEEKRWRCTVCPFDFVEPFAREIPKPIEEVEYKKVKK